MLLTPPLAWLNGLIGQRVALVDRAFLVVEGRVVYPTMTATVTGATDKVVFVKVTDDENEPPTAFFLDGLRCIRPVPDQPAQK